MQLFEQVTIVGCGLLGASLGLALKQRGLAKHVVGVGRNVSTLEKAQAAGAIDAHASLLDAASDSALVVLAVPVAQSVTVLESLAGATHPDAVLTDVGSTKAVICQRASELWPTHRRFVGAHPMAGSDKSGPEHARADLYEGCICLLEAHPALDAAAHAQVDALWQAVGARTVPVEAARHDAILAYTSHLPHVVAAALALRADAQGDVKPFVGNGLKDSTRIAASRPEVWTEICLTNREALLEAIDACAHELQYFRAALQAEDCTAVTEFFEVARDARQRIFPP